MVTRADEIRQRIDRLRGNASEEVALASEPLANGYQHSGEVESTDDGVIVSMMPDHSHVEEIGDHIDGIIDLPAELITGEAGYVGEDDLVFAVPHACAHIRTEDEKAEADGFDGDGDGAPVDLFATAGDDDETVVRQNDNGGADGKPGIPLRVKLVALVALLFIVAGGAGAWVLMGEESPSSSLPHSEILVPSALVQVPVSSATSLVMSPMSSAALLTQPLVSSARQNPADLLLPAPQVKSKEVPLAKNQQKLAITKPSATDKQAAPKQEAKPPVAAPKDVPAEKVVKKKKPAAVAKASRSTSKTATDTKKLAAGKAETVVGSSDPVVAAKAADNQPGDVLSVLESARRAH